jgi:hypothetical protein
MHSATGHATTQVKQYLRGVSDRDGLPLERLAGCAFDGSWIVYVTWEQGGGTRRARDLSTPRPCRLSSTHWAHWPPAEV